MIEMLVERLRRCQSDRDFFRVHTEAERVLTPLELQELLDGADTLPEATRAWLERVTNFTRFRDTTPTRFRRREIAANIDLYADPDVPRSAKRLILGFCGAAQRLLMPIANVLQFLPSRHCDVLVLRDPALRHFLGGIPPYADSFFGLLKSLAADVRIDEYERLYGYGTCLGGFAALRAGLLLGASRSVSVSGIFPRHARRLLVEPEKELPAFDPLCACYVRSEAKLACAYSMSHKRDRDQAAALARILPIEQLAAPGVSAHNLIEKLAHKNALGTFFNLIFDLAPGAGPSDIAMPGELQAEASTALFYKIPPLNSIAASA